MTLLVADMDLGAAIEGIARLYETLLMAGFELVVLGGLVIVFVFARQRRLAEQGQVRFDVHGREALGLPAQLPQRRTDFSRITAARWRSAVGWSLLVMATVWWAVRQATPWSPTALIIALFWASIVLAFTIRFDARAGRDSAATVVGVHLAMAGFFVWVHSH